MIRINIRPLLTIVEQKVGRKITLKEVSEKSGCDRNALSRLVNHPDIIPSASIIDKLAQFFFQELCSNDPSTHRDCMAQIMKDLVSVYPDNPEFWKNIPKSLKENKHMSAHEYWDLQQTQFTNP